MEGMFMMGQNPAVAAANSRFQRTSLSKLKWLVVREMVEIEGATFWYDSPEIERGELKAEDIETEVFFFPAAGHAEKEGAFTQTQRMLQWRQKAVNPPGDARSEGWFMHQLALRLIAKAKQSTDPLDEPLRALNWWYPEDELGDPKMEAVLAEINGWYTEPQPNAEGVVFGLDRDGNPHHGPQVDGFGKLKAGRPIVALYIIERARNRPVSHGASARNWFGGTRRKANGAASTSPIFHPTSRQRFGQRETRAA
jgi:anaerobic selenocysteine-containing dehydrogenase